MPCDTVQTAKVDLSSIGKISPELMLKALAELKLNPRRVTANGQDRIYFGYDGEYLDVRTGQSQLTTLRDANEIKRAYSSQVIQYQAKKNGWTLKQTAPNQYEAVKRF